MNDWKLISQRKGLRPLAVDPTGLLGHINGEIFHFTHDLKYPTFICKLPAAGLIGLLGNRLRIVDRIFRLAPSHAILFDDNLFISRRSEIWRCDLITGKLTLDFVIPDGRRALEFTCIKQSDGEFNLVFGEYFSNPTRQPVRIWGRASRISKWTVRATIAAGEIEHVHAITAVNDRVFVLCGDFEQAASIWVSDLNFSSITPMLRGCQSHRAAWIAELGGRIFYATDTQLEVNQLYELSIDGKVVSSNALQTIEGSSIYSGTGPVSRYFSTTVECGMPTGNIIRDVFEIRRGPGILSSRAKIMGIGADGICEEIFSAEKDLLPFRLAQFGTFTFPTGVMPIDTVFAYGTALRGFDDTCLILKK